MKVKYWIYAVILAFCATVYAGEGGAVTTETLEALPDNAVLAPNDSPRYPGDTDARRRFIKYWFLLNDMEFREDGWIETPIHGPYIAKGSGLTLYARPIPTPAGEVEGDWWKFRVYDEGVFGDTPLVVVYFNQDPAAAEFTGTNESAGVDNVNWLNFLPNDIWIYRLDRRWNYGRSFTHPDGWVGPTKKTILMRDGSWNGFRGDTNLGPAWGVMITVDPKLQRR